MLNISVKNDSICSDCGADIKINSYVYCDKCYSDLKSENKKLKNEIEILKHKIYEKG